jgi:hypothetical protein
MKRFIDNLLLFFSRPKGRSSLFGQNVPMDAGDRNLFGRSPSQSRDANAECVAQQALRSGGRYVTTDASAETLAGYATAAERSNGGEEARRA